MAKLDILKADLQKKKDELTTATAVMGQVKLNIEKEVATLKSLGVVFPDIADGQDEMDYFSIVKVAASEYVARIEEAIASDTKAVEEIISKWED